MEKKSGSAPKFASSLQRSSRRQSAVSSAQTGASMNAQAVDDCYMPLVGRDPDPVVFSRSEGSTGTAPTGEGCRFFVLRIVSVAILGSFLFGYNLGVMNGCNSVLAVDFRWCGNAWQLNCYDSHLYQTACNSIVFLGAVIGAYLSGGLLQWGRKKSLQLAYCSLALGGFFGFIANGIPPILISRILTGFGMGIVTVITPVYISEMAPPKDRGFYGSLHQLFISLGIFVSVAMGLPLRPNLEDNPDYVVDYFDSYWWRVMLGLNALPAALGVFCLTFWCTTEIPAWLFFNDETQEAAEVVKNIYRVEDVQTIEKEIIEMMRASEEAKGLYTTTIAAALQDRYYRPPLLLGFSLAAFQQLSGINVITSSSNEIFSKSGFSSETVTSISSLMQGLNLLLSMATTGAVEKLGRRPLLLIGLFLQWSSFLPLGIARHLQESHAISPDYFSENTMSYWSAVATFVFVLAFSFSMGPVVWIYLSEIYPVEIRGKALACCGVINWMSALFLVFISKFISLTLSVNIFAGVCLVAWIVSYIFVVETKGTSMDDSPMSPRSMRSESSLIQLSANSVCMEELKQKLRSAASLTQLDPSTDSGVDRAVEITEELSPIQKTPKTRYMPQQHRKY